MARGGSVRPIRAQCDMDSMFQLLQIDTAGCLEVVQERKGVPTLTNKVSAPLHLLTRLLSWHGAPRALGRSLMSTGV